MAEIGQSTSKGEFFHGVVAQGPAAAALVSVAAGTAVLFGWAFDLDVLKRLAPGFVAMSPMTAVALILAGAALLLLARSGPRRGAVFFARAAASAVAALGLLRITGYLAGADWGIDALLFRHRLFEPALGIVNRIAPNTALNMLWAGAALVCVSAARPPLRVAGQLLALMTGFLSLLGLVGYVYGANQLYGVGAYIPMALHTAAAFAALAGGILLLRPHDGFMRVIVSPGAGGVLARRLLPAVVLIPVIMGWLKLAAQRAGYFGLEFGSALRVVIDVLTMVAIVWWTAARLYRVDERRQAAEAELAAAMDAAQAANRAKSAFLANMSHEIRTPMSAIIGYTDLLMEAAQSPSDRLNNVNIIRRNGEHLLGIIDDILDLSKIEAGCLNVERVDCSPCQIISEVASMMRVRAVDRKIDFQVKIEGQVPALIRSDPKRLRQILINLTGNAVKFTETGWVRLSVRWIPADARLRFEVADTGIGITPDEITRLFTPFTQADTTTASRFGGTGLGLAISQRLAQNLNGNITVQSTPGQGSRFTLTIQPPLPPGVDFIDGWTEAAGAAMKTGSPDTGEDIRLQGRILLAEDGLDNRQLFAHYLRKAGADVTIVENGRLAVETAQQGFDLIFMDMRMPELDGYGATAKLRSRGYTGPIVALTAHAMSGDREKCLRCGCTDFLSKPVRKANLLEMAHRHLTGLLPPPPTEPPGLLRSGLTGVDAEVQQFLPIFVGNLPHQVARITHNLDRGNLRRLDDVLHQLKGSGGVYGFDRITHLAAQAQHSIEAGELQTITRDLNDLVALIRRVEGYDPVKEMEMAAGQS